MAPAPVKGPGSLIRRPWRRALDLISRTIERGRFARRSAVGVVDERPSEILRICFTRSASDHRKEI